MSRKTIVILFLVLPWLVLFSPLFAKASNGTIDDIELTEVIVSETEEDFIGDEVAYGHLFVYKPQNYSDSKKYNTLYIFEGLNSTENDALDAEGIRFLESLFADGMEDILVVVVPHVVYDELTFAEIINKIDGSYSTIQKSSGRIIAGFSNGAYYIWNNVLVTPQYYSMADTYIPMSPIGAREILSGNFSSIKYAYKRIKIYNSCGTEGAEADYRGLYSGEEQMELIIENGRKYGYIEGKNIFRYQSEGDHNWIQGWGALCEVLPNIVGKKDIFSGLN
ncbi:MAG: hypothetical protein IKO32_08525 [Lachnospiraceae bacterium]|nr:hypothetical protein [Lachnospiraceae bacterium]